LEKLDNFFNNAEDHKLNVLELRILLKIGFMCCKEALEYIAMQTCDFSGKAHFAIHEISVVGVFIFGAANNGARAVEMNVRWSSRQNVDRARRMGNGRTCLSEPTPYPHRDDEGERKCIYN
jgi:hypothetical protein